MKFYKSQKIIRLKFQVNYNKMRIKFNKILKDIKFLKSN